MYMAIRLDPQKCLFRGFCYHSMGFIVGGSTVFCVIIIVHNNDIEILNLSEVDGVCSFYSQS